MLRILPHLHVFSLQASLFLVILSIIDSGTPPVTTTLAKFFYPITDSSSTHRMFFSLSSDRLHAASPGCFSSFSSLSAVYGYDFMVQNVEMHAASA